MEEALATQRRAALRFANVVRGDKAKLKRDLASGATTLGEVLQDLPSHLHRARLEEILLAVPGMGKVRAQRALQELRLTGRTWGQSTQRQRLALLAYMRERHGIG